MRIQDVARLLLLAAIWGFSFIFMRVTVPVLGPVMTVEIRVVMAAIVLLVFGAIMSQPFRFREEWRLYLAIGALSAAFPFALICIAEIRLTASMAAILNATTPLFGAVVAAVWLGDSLTPKKVAGMLVAFVGVVVLVGWSPLGLSLPIVLSIAASLAASLMYGVGAAVTKKYGAGVSPMSLAAGTQVGACLLMGGAVPFSIPQTAPSLSVIGCVVALGLFCTGFAYAVYYRLVADIGPSRSLTTTFLAPIFGVLWGQLFLGEPISLSKILACGIILAGTFLATQK